MTIAAQNRTPQAGELVKFHGSELAVVLRQEEDFVPFIPLVSIDKDGSRRHFFVKPESLTEPHLGLISKSGRVL